MRMCSTLKAFSHSPSPTPDMPDTAYVSNNLVVWVGPPLSSYNNVLTSLHMTGLHSRETVSLPNTHELHHC